MAESREGIPNIPARPGAIQYSALHTVQYTLVQWSDHALTFQIKHKVERLLLVLHILEAYYSWKSLASTHIA